MFCENINTGCHGTVCCVAMVFEALNQKKLPPNQHVLHECFGYFLSVVTVMVVVALKLHRERLPRHASCADAD